MAGCMIPIEAEGRWISATAEVVEGNFRATVPGTRHTPNSTNRNIREGLAEAVTTKWSLEGGECCQTPGKVNDLRCSYLKTWDCRVDSRISR
jgi:hypothetical protein